MHQEHAQKPAKHRHIFLALKLALAAGLLYWLFQRGFISIAYIEKFIAHPELFVALIAMLTFSIILAAYRWRLLLSANATHISYRQALKIYFIGHFGSLFMPGSTGGDVLRMFYTHKLVPDNKTNIAISIIVDRLLGLFGLLILAVLSVIIYQQTLSEKHSLNYILTMTNYIFIAACFVGFVFFTIGGKIGIRKKLQSYEARFFFIPLIIRILTALRTYQDNLWAMLWYILLSVIIQAFVIGGLVFVTIYLEIGQLNMLDYTISGSFAMLANIIPVTPGGIGVGENAFNWFCSILQGNASQSVAPYATAFFTYRIAILISSLPGAVLLLFSQNGTTMNQS